jgi:hypothetical protein
VPSSFGEGDEVLEVAVAYRIVLLAENELTPEEVATVTSLHEGDELSVYLLMPARESHHGLAAALDDLLRGRVKEAWRDIEEPDTDSPMGQPLRRSVDLLTGAKVEADGRLVAGDPVRALRSAVADHRADEVVVLNPPHIVEESLRRDWAARARHAVGVPVLRIIAHAD